jgi:signal transduction histidine kinase
MNEAPARIVVVDDDEASRYLKARILRNAGYRVIEAGLGAEVIAAVESHDPEIVLLDVKLPDISGLDICRRLKARDSSLLILQTSATFVRGQDRAIGLDSGADAYLTEPVERDELLATVRALLRIHKAENGLRQLNETLEQRVAERTRELADANRQLLNEIGARRKAEEHLIQSKKMEAIGQLTGGVAHDFNNLLAVIIFNIEALHRRIPPELAHLRRLTDAAMQGAQRAVILIRRLLAFSRSQPLKPKPIDVNELVMSMSQLLRRTLGEHIAVETTLAPQIWRTSTDANELESALLNLALNARDAMPEGGHLVIETSNADLDEVYTKTQVDVAPGEHAMIAVADDGVGMTAEVVAKAFDPFFTTKEVGRGTGLGLSQVYGFVKQSGGHVNIYSVPGEGTVVRLYLPRLETGEPAFEDKAETQQILPRFAGETVLVVEDDAAVRASSVEMLQELGYRTLESCDGPAALRLLDEGTPIDLLFTDVGLPSGLNGRQLADEAKRRRPGLKVLFTTGYTRDAIVHKGRLEPGVELLSKPFTFAALAAKLRHVFEEPN